MAGGGSGSVVAASIRTTIRESESLLLRSYAVVGTLVAVFTVVLVVLALPGWVLATEGGVIDRVGRAFGVLVGLTLVFGMIAPLIFSYRRRTNGRPARDSLFGLIGYYFITSLFLALVASMPEELQDPQDGLFAPAIEFLFDLPQLSGLVFPVLALLLVFVVEYGLDRGE